MDILTVTWSQGLLAVGSVATATVTVLNFLFSHMTHTEVKTPKDQTLAGNIQKIAETKEDK